MPDLIVRREGAVGVIRLNRPKAINAVTLEMFRDIDKALDHFERDPAIGLILLEGAGERGLCAGGDIRALFESSKVKGDLGKILWREEYILNARIAKFPKPYVAFMDGIVMGGGVGLSAHGSHRVVTERTKLAMPEVGLGFFPDVGGTWLLSRSPGEVGTYFGLTGHTMNGPDAIYARFADAVVPSGQTRRVAGDACQPSRRRKLCRSEKHDRAVCDRRNGRTHRCDPAANRQMVCPRSHAGYRGSIGS